MFDPGDEAFLTDPYPAFDAARSGGEVRWHEGMGMWVALSHRACSAVLRSRGLGRVFVDAQPAAEFAAFNLLHRNSLLENEPPAHTRLRGLVSGAFARGHVERLRPWIESIVDELVSGLAERLADGSADVIEHLAAPLPVRVIAALLGVADSAPLQPWSNAIVKMYEYGLDAQRRAAAERAATEFTGHLREVIEARRAAPSDDLLTDLIAANDGGERLTADELVATAALLLMAGHEASVNTVGNGMLALLENPEQWRRLTEDPRLAESCVDEVIRFDSPLQCFERTAAQDVDIVGQRIARGEKIAALLGAAAHDPTVFADPASLDITRSPNPHLGFGAGIHYCLGAPLARLEATAALRALAVRLPELRLAGEPLRRNEFVIRGLHTLPVTDGRAPRPGRTVPPSPGPGAPTPEH